MTDRRRIGEARPRVAREFQPGDNYLIVGRSGLDTSYTRPGWVSSAASFSAFSAVRSVVPHTTVRPSVKVSVIYDTEGAATRLT